MSKQVDFNYFEFELDRTGGEGERQIQIVGEDGKTKWLSLRADEYRQVRALMIKMYEERYRT